MTINTIDEEIFVKNLIDQADKSRELLNKVNGVWQGEDGIYRFYHRSFKVFYLKKVTVSIVTHLRSLSDRDLNPIFTEIISHGDSKSFNNDTNSNWVENTKPVVDAFLHAKSMLELVVKYGESLKETGAEIPSFIPTGYGTLLHLYGMR